jgi:hypothetical protein
MPADENSEEARNPSVHEDPAPPGLFARLHFLQTRFAEWIQRASVVIHLPMKDQQLLYQLLNRLETETHAGYQWTQQSWRTGSLLFWIDLDVVLPQQVVLPDQNPSHKHLRDAAMTRTRGAHAMGCDRHSTCTLH